MTNAASAFLLADNRDYTVVETLYQGTRTAVCRAVEVATQRPVVIKWLAQAYPSFSDLVQFRNQYAIAKSLTIPGIVKPLSLESWDDRYALVMEDGGCISLDRYIQQRRSLLPLETVLVIALQLTKILHDLHQEGIIHKDIKPANILIHPETEKVQLIDFSIASLLPKETQAIQSPQEMEGTLAYLAPEQTGRMNRAIDHRTDFYAFGMTLYQLLTGDVPFTSDDPMELIHCHLARVPIAADRVNPTVPEMVARITSKLVEKNAEERYQSALGLAHDLSRCLNRWRVHGEIAPFELGQRDLSDRFLIPEKLYGRETEVNTLLAAFERVAGGTSELMLVAGFSGIGKTAVIHEIYKPITRQRGYFIQGKFDQFNRNVPFSALVQAFRNLMTQLQGESDQALEQWRSQILAAVGRGGQVLIDVIPELGQLIGPQPPVPELSGTAARNRFNRLFGTFVRVFATAEHPLVIFLDDLQWADAASLGLLELLMEERDSQHLLMLGAYRDNEVYPSHPLLLCLQALRKHKTPISTLTLEPLALADVMALVADTLRCSPAIAHPLAELIYQRTEGNPFFTTQFLQGLHSDGHLQFEPTLGHWQCDLTQLRQLALTNDVVEFMVDRLRQLPTETQAVLKLAACLGNRFDLTTLAVVSEQSQEMVAIALWPALQGELIVPASQTYRMFQGDNLQESLGERSTRENASITYRFLHDRVQQATYELIPEAEQAATYCHIGQLMLDHFHGGDADHSIFDIVGYLNFGRDLLQDRAEQLQLARLNHTAAAQAIASTAYDAAITYCQIAIALLGADAWDAHYDLALELHQHLGSAQLSSAAYDALESTLQTVRAHTRSSVDFAPSAVQQISSYTLQGRCLDAIQTGLDELRESGVDCDLDNLPALVERELAAMAQTMGDRDVYSLLSPATTPIDPKISADIQIALSLDPPTYISGQLDLYSFVSLRAARLSVEHGNIVESAKAYANYGLLLGLARNQYQRGYKFAEMAVRLAEQFGSQVCQCQTGLILGSWAHVWAKPIAGAAQANYDSFLAGMESGETQFAAYNLFGKIYNLLFQGESLGPVVTDVQTYFAIADRVQDELLRVTLAGADLFAQRLMMTSPISGEEISERIIAAEEIIRAGEAAQITMGIALHTALELHHACIVANFDEAIAHFHQLTDLLPAFTGFTTYSYYFYYGSIALLNSDSTDQPTDPATLWEQVEANQKQLEMWAESCPENFLHKYQLVKAECCRRRGEYLDAIELYDQAIAEANTNGYVQEEALANELAARFYLGWNKPKFAAIYLQQAYYAYIRWGARAKVQHLETIYPRLLAPILEQRQLDNASLQSLSVVTQGLVTITSAPRSSSSSLSQHLDLATVLQAAQTLTSTIELDRLLGQIVRLILVNSGAQKSLLLTYQNGQWQVYAQANLDSATNDIAVSTACEEVTEMSNLAPLRLLRYVQHTQESVTINGMKTGIVGIIEGYLLTHQPQSCLCVPLLSQGKLVAIAYLEHATSQDVFAAHRQTTIEFLCAQGAIALRNAQLYRRSQQSQQHAEQALADLKNAQLQLVQSEKMSALGNLMAGVAHEINNPLAFLQGNIQPAQDYVRDLLGLINLYQAEYPHPNDTLEEEIEAMELDFLREDLPNLLNSMTLGVDRIRNISSSLRIFARKDEENKTALKLQDGIDSTLLILKHRTKANGQRPEIQVVKDYGELPEVQCFPGQLNQVLMNLIANAIDALDEASQGKSFEALEAHPNTITIRITVRDRNIQIEIQDNGPGMPPEVREKIFEQGFTTKGVGKGTGLGLAIARKIIVDTHGGSLEVESTVGEGTEFVITLPMD